METSQANSRLGPSKCPFGTLKAGPGPPLYREKRAPWTPPLPTLEPWTKTQLLELLQEGIKRAGNPHLMSVALAETLAEHAAGTPRVMMNLASECLAMGLMKEAPQLDEGIFFDLYPASHTGATRKKAALQAAK